MSKITLNSLTSLQNETTALTTINGNSTTVQTAMDNTLSRDGTSPNQMSALIDMNSNRIINLPAAISTTEPVTLSQMTAALVANGNINTGLTGVPVSVAMQPVVAANTITAAQTLLKIPTPYVDAVLFGVTADGVTDDTAALQAAVTFAAGREVFLPPGTIVLTSTVSYVTSTLFVPGMRLRGSGRDKTFIDNRVANGPCLRSAGGVFLFQLGGHIKDLSIKTTSSQVNSHGIEHFSAYQYSVENVHIFGLSGDGIRVTANIGDADASNEMSYINCFVTDSNVGLNCNFATAVVQPSFLRMDNCFFQSNNYGVIWSGLSGMMINCAFTTQNVYGLWIKNNGGSNAQFTGIGNSFENNAQAIQCDALQGGTFIQTELAGSNTFFPSTKAVVINGSAGVEFTGTRVRVASSPHTLWTFTGANSCFYNTIKNSFYQNYDNAGQTRYSVDPASYGNRLDDSYQTLPSRNGSSSITLVNGANQNVVPLLDGTFLSASGPTGAFSIGGWTNGFPGRVFTFNNNTGFVCTINAQDAGSIAANRISTNGGTNITINNGGCITFLYNGSNWNVLGVG